jgi:hypothetical protein
MRIRKGVVVFALVPMRATMGTAVNRMHWCGKATCMPSPVAMTMMEEGMDDMHPHADPEPEQQLHDRHRHAKAAASLDAAWSVPGSVVGSASHRASSQVIEISQGIL